MRILILLLTFTTFVKDHCQATPSLDRQWGKLKPINGAPQSCNIDSVDCKNKFDGRGSCIRNPPAGMTCISGIDGQLCGPPSNFKKDCYCCDTRVPCQTLECPEKVKGGRCYPSKQEGMMCIQSNALCKKQSPNSDCYCCSNELSDTQCADKGCNEFFRGRGNCTRNAPATQSPTCVVSDKLCCGDKEEKPCNWTNWLDHDNPSATGDWEIHIPPYSHLETKIGPCTQCEYPEYRVRIKGSTDEYDDVNDLPGPWIIIDRPNGIYCKNSQQIAIPGCEGVQNQNDDTCCPDMEVKYKCCPPSSCCCCRIDHNIAHADDPIPNDLIDQ